MGLPAKRVKLMDFDGDGWPDVLVMNVDGAPWLAKQVAAGKEPSQQLKKAARTQLWSLYLSRPGAAGSRRFVDYTKESGIRCGRPYHLAIAGDIDNDGDLDLVCTGYATQHPGQSIETPAFVLKNDGHGCFTPFDQAKAKGKEPVGPGEYSETVCAASFVDYDRDGRLDLFLGSWYRYWGGDLQYYAAYPDRLYRGLGDGRFGDKTADLGMMQKESVLDTLSEAERKSGQLRPESREHFGRGAHKPTYGTAAADWDNDGDADLFSTSYGRQWNLHWQNEGQRFVEVGRVTRFDGDADRTGVYPKAFHPEGRRAELPFRSNGNSFDMSFADYDNDGDLDVVVSEFTHAWAGSSCDITRVLTNMGPEEGFAFERKLSLKRKHSRRNWNQGDYCTAWADIDGDGWQDLLISSCVYPDHNVLELYRQIPGTGRFVRMTELIGLDWPDSAQISLGDYDGDGDLDILAGNFPHPSRRGKLAERVALFRNDVMNARGHAFLSLRLEGRGEGGTSRSAVGTRVYVTTGTLRQLREVSAARGHAGHQDGLVVHFGLGRAKKIDRLEVHWSGKGSKPQVFEDVEPRQFLRLREGGLLTRVK
ncbi:MAG: hypothetical protein CSA62_15190 [Planctomycetota bacterium]|nr:MAG: hypothetical protein CSA62_15190 [Planctomycetota bacterium]